MNSKPPEESTENQYGPSESEKEFILEVPVSEIVEILRKNLKTNKDIMEDKDAKRCPYCNSIVSFYKDDWYFCNKDYFVKLKVEEEI